METINHKQGTQEWHDHRADPDHLNASDLPVAMGLSSHKTRQDLLRERATGITPDISPATQRIFDDGHKFEAMARPWAEVIVGEALSPLTGVSVIDGLTLSASFDGVTFGHDVCFEHKTLNAKLAQVRSIDELDMQYKVQMQQQMMVSGATRCLFVASKGVQEGATVLWYESDPALANDILAAWHQFRTDLENYKHTEEAVPVAAETVKDLPSVMVQVSGAIDIIDNFNVFEVALRDFIENRLIRSPQDDQDFADLDAQIKALKKAEAALDAAEVNMLAQVQSVDAIKRTKDMLHKLARDNRLVAEKLLSAEKANRRNEILQAGKEELAKHIATLNESLGGKVMLPMIQADFVGAMKNKRTIASLLDAVDTTLAQAKIDSSQIAGTIKLNLESLRADASGYEFLFADAQQLVMKENDDLKNLIATRISDHKKAEETRLEAERERIRKEEREKIEADRLLQIAEDRRKQQEEEAGKPAPTEETAPTTEVGQEVGGSSGQETAPSMGEILAGVVSAPVDIKEIEGSQGDQEGKKSFTFIVLNINALPSRFVTIHMDEIRAAIEAGEVLDGVEVDYV